MRYLLIYFCIFLYISVFAAGCKTPCRAGYMTMEDCFLGMCKHSLCQSWELQAADFDFRQSPVGWVYFPRDIPRDTRLLIDPNDTIINLEKWQPKPQPTPEPSPDPSEYEL